MIKCILTHAFGEGYHPHPISYLYLFISPLHHTFLKTRAQYILNTHNERQRDRETGRQRDRQTDRQTERKKDKYTDKKTHLWLLLLLSPTPLLVHSRRLSFFSICCNFSLPLPPSSVEFAIPSHFALNVQFSGACTTAQTSANTLGTQAWWPERKKNRRFNTNKY